MTVNGMQLVPKAAFVVLLGHVTVSVRKFLKVLKTKESFQLLSDDGDRIEQGTHAAASSGPLQM
jgi:hypothetical protein